MFCPLCGTELPENRYFCAQCGVMLNELSDPKEIEAVKSGKRLPIWRRIRAARMTKEEQTKLFQSWLFPNILAACFCLRPVALIGVICAAYAANANKTDDSINAKKYAALAKVMFFASLIAEVALKLIVRCR